jgi:D-alanine transaminase
VHDGGIAVCTQPDLRWKRCDIKSLNLLANVLARREAARRNCAEAILVDDAGLITEGAASSFFAVFGRTLRTAPLTANILPSITRRYVMNAAENLGMKVLQESMTVRDAAGADELFTAVTTQDIVPVIRFDDADVSGCRCGSHTRRIRDEFRSFT